MNYLIKYPKRAVQSKEKWMINGNQHCIRKTFDIQLYIKYVKIINQQTPKK